METQIFLNKYKNKQSTNTSEGLDVELKGKRKLLPFNDFGETISQNDQYMEERQNCNKIRLTCQVNVVASNVLFNKISEIVRHEGSDHVSMINYGISASANTDDFTNVRHKSKEIGFWSGSDFHYQQRASWDINTIDEHVYGKQQDAEYLTNGTHNDIKCDTHCTNAIRDTQLSNNGFIYHCGLDIFNNHLIRSNVFKWVNRLNESGATYDSFNTIADLFRNIDGNNVVERIYFPKDAGVTNRTKLLALHLYEHDDVDTFLNCHRKKLLNRYDGWLGFKNKSKIKTYNNFRQGETLDIDRPIMYAHGGDFIEMYPTSDLFSFVPLYNDYQRRIEKNWDYCITYPSYNTVNGFDDIIETNYDINALKALYFDENTRYDNGVSQIVIHSVAKHGLSVGDYVNIYQTYNTTVYWVIDNNLDGTIVSIKSDKKDYIDGICDKFNAEYEISHLSDGPYKVTSVTEDYSVKIIDNAEVQEVVDDYTFVFLNSTAKISREWVELTDDEKKYRTKPKRAPLTNKDGFILDKTIEQQWVCTSTSSDNIHKYYVVNESYVNFDDRAQRISFKKVVNDIECDYYIRVFSKLPNFKFASADTSTQFELYKNDQETIKRYRDIQYDFQSSPTRLAYSQNIYGDTIGEIVFLDDIDMTNIVDNLGRPLSSLYLTFIKNNRGYKEWYGFGDARNIWNDGNAINKEHENIEFSHCFGMVSCGIECSDETAADNLINNIKTISNTINSDSNSGHGYDVFAINTYDDILVENKFTDISATAQRKYDSYSGTQIRINRNEIWYNIDENFYGDLCYYDNYNAIERPIQQVLHRFNTAQRESFLSASSNIFSRFNYDEIWQDDYDTDDNYIIRTFQSQLCNRMNEGYYYQPHYEIPIHYFGKLNYITPDFLTIRQILHIRDNIYSITCLENHFLSVGDKAVIYDMLNNKYYNCVTISGENDTYKVFTFKLFDYDNDEKEETLIYVSDGRLKSSDEAIRTYRLFKTDNLDIPSYARLLRDGTCRFIWRDLYKNGIGIDKKEVEEYTFTNGAFYINRKVDIFVRRQDKYNMYGLYNEMDRLGIGPDVLSEDNYVKDTEIEC